MCSSDLCFDAQNQPRLDTLLDLVALGTVADVVRLDANNRRLVAQGLKRIRAGRMQAGVAALFAVARREPARASAFDFGFALGPRINAAGRLADMTLGIECLTTDDAGRAAELAAQLDAINRERREVEAGMRALAEAAAGSVYLAVRDGLDMVLIEACRPRSTMFTPRLDVGSRAPLANSALGRAYLWALPAQDRHQLIESLRLARGSDWDSLEPGLLSALRRADRCGYTLSEIGRAHV